MADKSLKKPTYDIMTLNLMDVEEALFKFRGLLPLAASYLGVEEHALYQYIQQDPALCKSWQDSRRLLKAKAESVLQGFLESPDDRIKLRACEVLLKSINDENKNAVLQNIQVNGSTGRVQISSIFGV